MKKIVSIFLLLALMLFALPAEAITFIGTGATYMNMEGKKLPSEEVLEFNMETLTTDVIFGFSIYPEDYPVGMYLGGSFQFPVKAVENGEGAPNRLCDREGQIRLGLSLRTGCFEHLHLQLSLGSYWNWYNIYPWENGVIDEYNSVYGLFATCEAGIPLGLYSNLVFGLSAYTPIRGYERKEIKHPSLLGVTRYHDCPEVFVGYGFTPFVGMAVDLP